MILGIRHLKPKGCHQGTLVTAKVLDFFQLVTFQDLSGWILLRLADDVRGRNPRIGGQQNSKASLNFHLDNVIMDLTTISSQPHQAYMIIVLLIERGCRCEYMALKGSYTRNRNEGPEQTQLTQLVEGIVSSHKLVISCEQLVRVSEPYTGVIRNEMGEIAVIYHGCLNRGLIRQSTGRTRRFKPARPPGTMQTF